MKHLHIDTSMAHFKSSMYSVPTQRWKYDVFLSFRGEDTRYNFVDHLYAALVQRGLCVFKDEEKLRSGKAISPELLKAIEESRFAVVVFSKNYANSSWCLIELAKIIECHNRMGQKVLPVFYHVDPSDIRGQKNHIAIFFQQHEEKYKGERDKVNEWRKALTATANLSGMHISETIKQGESTYINKIVHQILGDIQPYDMDNNLVGIKSHMDALNSLMGRKGKEEVCMVGIHGMGGIGKTTIAKAFFRRMAYLFEGSSFLKDVRENSSSRRDICALQEKLLREILMINHNFNVQDPEDGANMIRARFVHKKVLIVLDDVDDRKQLELLAAAHDSFGPGSRIIITTRNEQLISDANAKYKPDCLPIDEALELFSSYAFKTKSPPEEYEELSCRAIHCAGYLPLAVKVLGSFFHGRRASMWESAFNRLAKAPNVEIFETLKLSFDGLEVSEKKIFLDIACFFKGKTLPHVTKVLESCGFDPQIGISVLIEKSLITISGKEIGMHDLIQEMGWQIVRESFPNSRLWQLEDIHDFISRNKKLKAIEAIVVSYKQYEAAEYDKVGFDPNVFERMKNLRLLDIRGGFTSSEPTFLPIDLRWLCWSQYPFSSLPLARLSKLVGLEVVRGAIKQFWQGQKIMPNLRFIKLQQLDCLTKFPDVSGAPNIEKLFLYGCTNLDEVHESLGSHKKLVTLYIIGCERLKCLPSRIKMESLKFLKLNKCSSLERFPEVSSRMVKLSRINLDYCLTLQELPSSLGNLSSLDYLNLRRCTSLRNINIPICKEQHNIPEEHGHVEKLVKDGLPKSISLHTLTNSRSLRTLNLSWRQMESEDFPDNLHAISSLENLDLSGNNKLIRLPESISHLSHLKSLKVNNCHRLQILHDLPSKIQSLEANSCYSLQKIEDLSEVYNWWYYVSFINCKKLVENEVNERYLDKMLQQSFLKRCAVADHPLTIVIPGKRIPSWFKEEQPGYKITLMIPPRCNKIIGFSICGVFPGEWRGTHDYRPFISFTFKKDGIFNGQKEVYCLDASATAEFGNTWISYRPFTSLRGFQCDDWSGGSLLTSITVAGGVKAVRCAACLMYREDMESIQQITTRISRRTHTKKIWKAKITKP